ncbi:ATP-binding protein [Hydrogenophaga sp.]|uniref:hybrid sensor histidine kinase/response regulator n=1 Tax=Hydrogenophaga sp. TaxID=1904254 RepID=UPI002723DA1F|nr:ATP-binding protein [Hydrogenophaga sp.]MDO9438117.1 ATP-binding protein [Hydrogenophaga sp.]
MTAVNAPGSRPEKPTSLRQQLTLAALLTTLLAILLSAGALLTYEFILYRNAGVAEMRAQADLMVHSTAPAVERQDSKGAWEGLYLLKRQPRIRAAAVYGADGTLMAFHTTKPDELPTRIALDAPTWGPRFSGSTLEMTQTIERDGQRLGALYLKAEHGVWDRFADFALIVLAVSAVSLAAAFYLFVHLQRRITAPLQKMTDVARDVIVSHNWSLRAPATDYKDVGVLVDAFNRMLSECETRTSELEREMVTRQGVEHELRQADRHKDEFLATLAHELRNPLSPMTSAVTLLQMPAATPQAREKAMAVLERQLKHMVRLINDLLDTSRVATGKLSLNLETLDIGDLLNAVSLGAQDLATQHGLQLTLHASDETLCVNGDTVRLTQVFSNLLTNACRYTLQGGRVDVRLWGEEAWVVVEVADTGIGVEPGMQERIFDLFEQADKTLQRGNAGLGVGLTLSRQIIQLHEGTLAMNSAGLNLGSTFTVRLPRASVEILVPEERAAPLGRSASRPLSVLVADDNVDLAESFADILMAHGHRVTVVHDGLSAVEQARQFRPGIALLDIGMPKLDGYQVARQLKADPLTQGICLVAITGWGLDTDREAARQAGFDHHMLKPVAPEELIRVLDAVHTDFEASRPGELPLA